MEMWWHQRSSQTLSPTVRHSLCISCKGSEKQLYLNYRKCYLFLSLYSLSFVKEQGTFIFVLFIKQRFHMISIFSVQHSMLKSIPMTEIKLKEVTKEHTFKCPNFYLRAFNCSKYIVYTASVWIPFPSFNMLALFFMSILSLLNTVYSKHSFFVFIPTKSFSVRQSGLCAAHARNSYLSFFHLMSCQRGRQCGPTGAVEVEPEAQK